MPPASLQCENESDEDGRTDKAQEHRPFYQIEKEAKGRQHQKKGKEQQLE